MVEAGLVSHVTSWVRNFVLSFTAKLKLCIYIYIYTENTDFGIPISLNSGLASFNGICRYGSNQVQKMRSFIVSEDNKKMTCYSLCAGEVGCTAFTLKDYEADEEELNCFLYENGPYTYGDSYYVDFTCYSMGKHILLSFYS